MRPEQCLHLICNHGGNFFFLTWLVGWDHFLVLICPWDTNTIGLVYPLYWNDSEEGRKKHSQHTTEGENQLYWKSNDNISFNTYQCMYVELYVFFFLSTLPADTYRHIFMHSHLQRLIRLSESSGISRTGFFHIFMIEYNICRLLQVWIF